MRAILPQTIRVQIERVILDGEPTLPGDALLALFDLGVKELFHPTALQADQMVVVLALVELKHGLAGFEIVTFQQTCLFELCQHAIDGCQADVLVVLDQLAIDIFGGQVLLFGILEQFQDFEPGMSGLEADVLEAAGIVYHDLNPVARMGGRYCVWHYVIFFNLS